MMQLNVWSGKFSGAQGIEINPAAVVEQAKIHFSYVTISQVDRYSKRAQWAKEELLNESSSFSKKFLTEIIEECDFNLPALSFSVSINGESFCECLAYRFGIKFYTVEMSDVDSILLEQIKDFLNKFDLVLDLS
ncbi:hypothetical protein ACJJIU_11270 [Microbulbifer sp. CnH-101-E]|uniref:hypothetical protein n=1 Tax=unclassified Microbulbifer TaxID=2619833 RepID=UPI00403A5AEE